MLINPTLKQKKKKKTLEKRDNKFDKKDWNTILKIKNWDKNNKIIEFQPQYYIQINQNMEDIGVYLMTVIPETHR